MSEKNLKDIASGFVKSGRPPFGGWLDNSLRRIHGHRVLRNHNNKRLKAYLKGAVIFRFRGGYYYTHTGEAVPENILTKVFAGLKQ